MTKQVTPTYRKPVQRTGHEAVRVMRTVCAQAHQGPRRSHSLRQRPDIWQQPDIDMGILRPCKWGGDHICAEERSAPQDLKRFFYLSMPHTGTSAGPGAIPLQ